MSLRSTIIILAATIFFCGVSLPALAGQYEEAEAAEGRGDFAEALRIWRLLAYQGDAEAQFRLGIMHAQGKGVTLDWVKVAHWFRLAAEQGHAQAQYNLGVAYAEGRGVARDDAEAVRWFRLAAAQGYALAQHNLGVAYAEGRGVARDDAEAVRWFRLAAEQGDALAQYNLGVMYTEGRGVARDDAEAVRWFRLAAAQGYAPAALALSWHSDGGELKFNWRFATVVHVPNGTSGANEQERFLWLKRAARGGSSDALEILRLFHVSYQDGPVAAPVP